MFREILTATGLAGVATLALPAITPAYAGAILSPSGVVVNNMGGTSTTPIINQVGLLSSFVSGETDYDTYIAGGPTHAALTSLPPFNGWASATGFAGKYMEFDLGGTYSILAFALWNQTTSSAIKSFTLTSALDANFTSGVTSLGTFTANQTLVVQSFTIAGTGEYVRLQVNSNYITNNLGNANMGEVAFDVVSVPEPGTFAVLGMAFAALVARRRARGMDTART